jgi:hypothetical protein
MSLDIATSMDGSMRSDIHVPIVACGVTNDARAAVKAIHAGAKEYIPLPPDPELIAAVLAAVADDSREMIYRDDAMAKVVKLAQQIAGSDASVLITGESGTGKEVLARYLHSRSAGRGPFIRVNCAAIPDTLLESELFGHETGAVTGAIARRVGKFEEANGGSLLLDEVSEMDVRLQAKLLRAIQERVIDRVGGTRPVPVDIRIIATSNRNLTEAVRDGTFEDLLFRLNVVNLKIPCCATARPTSSIAEHFARMYADANGCRCDLCRRTPTAAAVAGPAMRELEHHPPRRPAATGDEIGADAILSPDGVRLDQSKPQAVAHAAMAADVAAPWSAARRRRRARPNPRDAQALPRQPHPCGQYPGHLDPHAAQQAQRIRRRRAMPPPWRRRARWRLAKPARRPSGPASHSADSATVGVDWDPFNECVASTRARESSKIRPASARLQCPAGNHRLRPLTAH